MKINLSYLRERGLPVRSPSGPFGRLERHSIDFQTLSHLVLRFMPFFSSLHYYLFICLFELSFLLSFIDHQVYVHVLLSLPFFPGVTSARTAAAKPYNSLTTRA